MAARAADKGDLWIELHRRKRSLRRPMERLQKNAGAWPVGIDVESPADIPDIQREAAELHRRAVHR
jgi:hypothetical protein